MCTVTYIPTRDGFYFTSSRDEKVTRNTVLPKKYNVNGAELIYPKDKEAGGTWFASSCDGRTACLLNGAFENHIKAMEYRKSRGLVLLESFQSLNAYEYYQRVNLANIEPFTLLTIEYFGGIVINFSELRWDGKTKYFKALSGNEPKIWSSATLYNSSARKKREGLFNHWIEKHKDFENRMILDFHNSKHGLKPKEDILMKGENDLQTLSISQVYHSGNLSLFKYKDIIGNTDHQINLTKESPAHA